MKLSLLAALLGFCALNAGAQGLELPPQFASGMVLQHSADVELWGWAEPGAEVRTTVSWDKAAHKTVADAAGRWSIVVRTPGAGYTPRTLTFASKRQRLVIDDVLLGDVWLLGGQSNMQMSFHGNPDQPVENAQQILMRSRRDGIRLFRVVNGFAYGESDTLRIDGKWTKAGPANVKDFSVVGYVFGEKLHEMADIPIGLVQAAHGGSTAEAWIDRATLERFGGLDLDDLETRGADGIWYSLLPTVLYNKMLRPLLPLSVKGVVWYQGESNVERPEQYKTLFPLLIDSWRRYLHNPDLPFYYVQIAPYDYGEANSALLREAQLETMRRVPDTGMAVALDAGERDVIHPARKEIIGERLALWALNRDYGYTALDCRGPELRSMEVRGSRAVLKFDFAPGGLSFFGKSATGFEIAGSDRIFHPARARIVPAFWGNEGLEVWCDEVAEPVAVRYGFSNWVEGSLYNLQGLPASSFRTDDWNDRPRNND